MSIQNVYSKNIKGMIAFTGNTLGLNGSCSSFEDIYTGCDTPGVSGLAGTWITVDSNVHANSNWESFVNNLDPSDTNGGTTFDYNLNSSSGLLNIPDNVNIDYAILIWCGNRSSGNVDVSNKSIKLTPPSLEALDISPEYYFFDESSNGYYTCASDITQVISNNLSGDYICGSIYSEFSDTGASAGWQIIVVYTSDNNSYVNVSINIGNIDVSTSESVSRSISGFQTSKEGFTLSAGALITALRGNPSIAEDNISITDKNNLETVLSGPFNPVNNFFGSQILNLQNNIDTSGTFGNLNATPNSVQTIPGNRTGFDMTIVNLAPALSPEQTSTTLRAYTSGNAFYIPSFTSIIRNAAANVFMSLSSLDNKVFIGDSYNLTYTISNSGTGDTASNLFTFNDLSGLEFVSGSYYIDSSNSTDITSSPIDLELTPVLEAGQSMIVSLRYKASKIPTDLFYKNIGTNSYSFVVGVDTFSDNSVSNYDVDIDFNKTSFINVNTTFTEILPLVDPTDSDLSYSIKQDPTKGVASLSSSGVLSYTPNNLGNDVLIISVTNNITNKTLDLTYNFNILQNDLGDSIPSRLLDLLENNIYLRNVKKLQLPINICFDCNLYNNGYSYDGSIIILPIKTTFISILDDLIYDLTNMINLNDDTNCSSYAFKSQLDRYLNLLIDLKNKVDSIVCDDSNCNSSLIHNLLDLLSKTIIYLINVSVNIYGASSYCELDCFNCTSYFDIFMRFIVNNTTLLYNLSTDWGNLSMSFMYSYSNYQKSYVPIYIPRT